MKHQPSPTAAIITPPIDGPSRRAALTIDEFERDRVREVISSVHHLNDKSLSSRHVESINQTLKDAKGNYMPDLYKTGKRQES
jgi:hypothetical protein